VSTVSHQHEIQEDHDQEEIGEFDPLLSLDVIIKQWRNRQFNAIMRRGIIVGLPAIIIAIVYYIRIQNWSQVIALGVIYTVFLIITFTNVPYEARAYAAIIVAFSFFFSTLIFVGVRGVAGSFLITTFLVAYLLLGSRVAFTILGFTILSVVGVGWGVVNGFISLELLFDQTDPYIWLINGTFPVILALIIYVGVMGLHREFVATQMREREALIEVSRERASLEKRVTERTQDLRNSNQELKLAYQKLLSNQEILLVSEKMASLGRLSAGIAHEMNTPLAAVEASLFEISKLIDEYDVSIGDKKVNEEDHHEIANEMREMVNISGRSLNRVQEFVRSIKSQSRISDRQEFKIFNVTPLVEEAILLLAFDLRKAGCKVIFYQQSETYELYGLPGNFTQIITNLLTNAIEASVPKNGGAITIKLETNRDGFDLQVSDQGVGISDEHKSKIFDPMFTTKPFGEKAGLGLTMVHDLVTNAFQGTIEVTTQLDQGTTFSIHFPYPDQGHTPSDPNS